MGLRFKNRLHFIPVRYLWSERRIPGRTLFVGRRRRWTSRSPPCTGTPCCALPSTPSPPPGSRSRRCCNTDIWAGSSTARWSGRLYTARTGWQSWPCSAQPCACRADTWRRWGFPRWMGLCAGRWERSPPPSHTRGRRRAAAAPGGETAERGALRLKLPPLTLPSLQLIG